MLRVAYDRDDRFCFVVAVEAV
jgi:hypothetical protein